MLQSSLMKHGWDLARRAIWVIFALASLRPSIGFAQEKPPTIDRDLLAGVEDRAPVRTADENYYEFRAYNYLLLEAHNTPPAMLAKYARRDLTLAHLLEEPAKYRGQLVHVEGQLRRLRKFDAPKTAAKEGVAALYEGWIFEEGAFANPYCVITSEVPLDLPLAEKMERRVAFDGYFFKKYAYKAGDGWRVAPLLIGRNLTLLPTAATQSERESDSFPSSLLQGFVAVALGCIVLGILLHWGLKRGDLRVRARLSERQKALFVEPGTEESEGGQSA
jgi:hypothetical protein